MAEDDGHVVLGRFLQSQGPGVLYSPRSWGVSGVWSLGAKIVAGIRLGFLQISSVTSWGSWRDTVIK